MNGLGRAILRAAKYPGIPVQRFLDFWLRGRGASLPSRVEWLQQTAIAHRDWIGLQVRARGPIPRNGLIVANHVSYLDIVALSALGGFAFVAKKDVSKWPIFGAYARAGATIFIDRERRGAVSGVTMEIKGHIEAGIPLVLFPEGTSTSGSEVRPFRSSLLEPVVQLGCDVTPCGIRYMLPGDGDVASEVAYWGDMMLGPHLFNLMRKRGVIVEIQFGEPRQFSCNRKRLARELHEEVRELAGLLCPREAAESSAVEMRGALRGF